MKIAGMIFLWLVALAAPAQTSQALKDCRNPVRVFGPGASVNLAPLFQWWERQPAHAEGMAYTNADINPDTNSVPDSDRPLSAWHLVTGIHIATMGSSWVVNAVIYTSPTARTNTRIILKHPPAVEEQNYYALKTQLVEAGQQITNDTRAYQSDVKAEQQDEKRAGTYHRSSNRNASSDPNNLAEQKQQDAATMTSQQQQLETLRDQDEQQLKTIPAVNGVYHVEWFAVKVGYTKQGLPIYDMGLVSPNPP